MKQKYIIPTAEAIKVKTPCSLLAGSPLSFDTSNPETPDDTLPHDAKTNPYGFIDDSDENDDPENWGESWGAAWNSL